MSNGITNHLKRYVTKGQSIANAISVGRAVSSVPMVYYCISQKASAVLVIFAVALSTDFLDGYISRKYGYPSEFGARLDSMGDFFVYSTFLICAWRLWPNIVFSNLPYVLIIVVSYFSPAIVSLIKFGMLPSYHTWSSKVATIFVTTSLVLLFGFNISTPFRIAAMLQSFVALENILISCRLSSHRSNIKSIFHLRHR